MKLNKLTALATMVILMLTITAGAMAKGAYRVKLSAAATLAGTSIGAGEYKVETDEQSAGIKVTFMKGKTTVATAEGKLVERHAKFPNSSVVYGGEGGGAPKITELRLAGMSQAIVFEN